MQRDNSPDALFGCVLTMEAVLAVLVAQQALRSDTSPQEALEALRRRVEELLKQRHETKYGTGAELIADGQQDSLQAIFSRGAEMVAARVTSP